MFHVKKWFTAIIIALLAIGLYYVDNQMEDGLWAKIEYMVLPDPMVYNAYEKGECTFYVFEKIKEDGNMIGVDWYDAGMWASNATDDDYKVDQEPAPGAVLQTERGELGHVAYIESVKKNGSLVISEMNYNTPYEITERLIPAEKVGNYSYIHPKENPRPKSIET
ncbi:CHAP domain-containing protein [Salinicoccus siamensis]|uniref:CHAP domain-containing protein n=1 Tax=Salinicoccus siamensis TaxID=381830 RepID=A0ABV5Z2Z8_9STAP